MRMPRFLQKKYVLIICAVLLLITPLALVVARYPPLSLYIARYIGKGPVTYDRYRVESSIPEYAVLITDDAYLDWLTDQLRIFEKNGIVDPAYHNAKKRTDYQRTVRSIVFRLVDHVYAPVAVIPADVEYPETPRIIGSAEYAIEDDTLAVNIYLNIPEITRKKVLKKYEVEEALVRLTTQALYSASVEKLETSKLEQTLEVSRSIRNNLREGFVSWPLSIKEK